MASRKQFHKLIIPGGTIERRGSAVGGTVIGHYQQGTDVVVVVEMPKAEPKKGKKKVGPVTRAVVDAVKRQETQQEVASNV
jgi:hypothetical protein